MIEQLRSRLEKEPNIMRFLLAAYDPAQDSADGCYWAWSHADLPMELLNRFYYEFAAKNLPANSNKLSSADCHGGWAGLDEEWACWYRFVDGGRDLRGRPGRFVLICAFYDRARSIEIGDTSILRSEPFQELSRSAINAPPLKKPDDLELEIALSEMHISEDDSEIGSSDWETSFEGEDGRKKAILKCAKLPRETRFHCRFESHTGQVKTALDIASRRSPSSVPDIPVGRIIHLRQPETLTQVNTDDQRRHDSARIGFGYGPPWWAFGAACVVCLAGGFAGGYYLGQKHSGVPSQTESRPASFRSDEAHRLKDVGRVEGRSDETKNETRPAARSARPEPKPEP